MANHTYRFYTTHDINHFCVGDGEQFRETGEETTGRSLQRSLEFLNILDLVPTLDNFRPLIDEYARWWERVDLDWNVFEKAKKEGSHLVALDWILSRVLQDTQTSPDILRYAVKTSPTNIVSIVYNPNVPEDLLIEVLGRNTKNDPTRRAGGGEIGRFIIVNKKVSGRVLDLIARKTKKVAIQRGVCNHPNVSRETLVWLTKEGRNGNVQRVARNELIKRGPVRIDSTGL